VATATVGTAEDGAVPAGIAVALAQGAAWVGVVRPAGTAGDIRGTARRLLVRRTVRCHRSHGRLIIDQCRRWAARRDQDGRDTIVHSPRRGNGAEASASY